MSTSLIKSGVIRSRVDHRDYVAEGIFHEQKLARLAGSPFVSNEPLPPELFLFDDDQLRVGGNGVYNQGASFKCVAYVGCTIREKQIHNETLAAIQNAGANAGSGTGGAGGTSLPIDSYDADGNPVRLVADKVTFSKEYLYDQRENSFTDGMSGADLMRILVSHGCVEEEEHDHYLALYNSIADLERQKRLLGAGTADDAAGRLDHMIHEEQNKLSALIYKMKADPAKQGSDVYAKVTTVNGLKQSLLHNGPCLIILPFYGNPHNITFWLPPDNNSVDEMGHAVTVMGYSDTEQSFYLRNTWGPAWNGTGHVWLPYSNLRLAWEMWTVFPRGTDHLVYHKKRSGAGIAGGILSPYPPVTTHSAGGGSGYAGCPQGECKRSSKPTEPREKKKKRSKCKKSKIIPAPKASTTKGETANPISVLTDIMSDEKSMKQVKKILQTIFKKLKE